MKIIAFIALFPSFVIADCEIPLESVKPSVEQVLLPLHEQSNLSIEQEDFRLAHQQILEMAEQIKACEIYHRDYERENYHRFNCGSNVEWSGSEKYPDWVSIAVATLDTSFNPESIQVIHEESKACWLEI